MTLLALIAIILFGFAVYNLSTAFADIPTSKTSKMMMLARKQQGTKKEQLLDVYITKIAGLFAPYLRLDKLKRNKLQAALNIAGLELTPEVYTARAWVTAGAVGLSAIPLAFLIPLFVPVLIGTAVALWFSTYYAAFDFCQMPFKDNSIDVISDGGGIGNCEGVKAKALKEAYRVLKPGGKLITSTGFVNKETLAALPAETQRVLIQKRPDVFEDLYEDTVLAGFSKIDSVISGCWYTGDDESTIADLARSLGVNLKFTSYTRYCSKE